MKYLITKISPRFQRLNFNHGNLKHHQVCNLYENVELKIISPTPFLRKNVLMALKNQ